MHIVVIYRSNYGHTRRYADWLAEEFGTTAVDLATEPAPSLKDAQALVAVLPIYAARLTGAKELKALAETYPTVPVVLACVGASGTETGQGLEARQEAVRASLPEALVERRAHVFQLRGGIDYGKLKFFHSMIMRMVNAKMKADAKRSGDADAVARAEAQAKSADHTDRATLAPLIDRVRELAAQ